MPESTTIIDEPWSLSTADVMKRYRVSAMTVLRWRVTGALPALKLPGGHFRYRESDVANVGELVEPGNGKPKRARKPRGKTTADKVAARAFGRSNGAKRSGKDG